MIEQFLEASSGLRDGRFVPFVQHPLNELVLGALVGVLCGAEDWDEVELLCEAKIELLRHYLPYKGGIASSDTFERAFSVLEPDAFGACVMNWIKELIGVPLSGVVAVDGKAICGAKQGEAGKALHVLSAFAHEAGLVIGQMVVDGKSNEITAIPDLLNMLALEGTLVTIDAMGAQKTIAAAIRGHKADYLLALKGNQGTLHEDVRLYFAEPAHVLATQQAKTVDCGHGRIEERVCYTTEDTAWLRERHPEWPDLRTIVAIVSTRTDKKTGQASSETRFYITSLPSDAGRILAATRAHWSIENNLYWMLDVLLNEDDCLVRDKNTALNLNTLRKTALVFLKSAPAKIPIKRKIKKACADVSFLKAILSC